jgi:predicted transcriptional regulator
MDHTPTTTLTLTITLPAKIAERLQAMAQEQQRSLTEIVQDILEAAFADDEDEWEEDSDEQILADLRETLENFQTGRTRDIRDIMADIEQEQKLKNS